MMRRNVVISRSTSFVRSQWPRILAGLLLILVLIGAACRSRWSGRFPVWVEIAAFLAISLVIAVLIEYGGASDEGP